MGERRCLGAGEYADAFFWLSDACISCTCYGVGDPAVGLSSTADEGSFKCYMADTGLLVAQLFADSEQTPHEVYRDVLLGKLETNEGLSAEVTFSLRARTAYDGSSSTGGVEVQSPH